MNDPRNHAHPAAPPAAHAPSHEPGGADPIASIDALYGYIDYAVRFGGDVVAGSTTVFTPQADGVVTSQPFDPGQRVLAVSIKVTEVGAPIGGADWSLDIVVNGSAAGSIAWSDVVQDGFVDWTPSGRLLTGLDGVVFVWNAGAYPTSAPPFPAFEYRIVWRDEWGSTTGTAGDHTDRPPAAHAASHEPGGSDAMAVDQAAATASLRTLGTAGTSAAAGDHTHAGLAGSPVIERTVNVTVPDPAAPYSADLFAPGTGERVLAVAVMAHAMPTLWEGALRIGDDAGNADGYAEMGLDAFTLDAARGASGGTYGASPPTYVGTETVTTAYAPGGASAEQGYDLTGGTGGTFTLTYGADTTAPIAVTGTLGDVAAALLALPSIGVGDVVVNRYGDENQALALATGGGALQFNLRFAGALAMTAQPHLGVSLDGWDEGATVTQYDDVFGAPAPTGDALDVTIKFLVWQQTWT